MLGSKRVICIIPARLQSSRFPRKILASLKGKPLIQWVWEAANQCKIFDEVAFAIDAEETAQVIQGFNGKYWMTSKECLNGTARLIELKKRRVVQGDIWVNWQADEPFISAGMIHDLLQSSEQDQADIWTLKKRLKDPMQIASPDICKVVCDLQGFALYFSRCPIPYHRPPHDKENIYYKHVGLYAFSDASLEKISYLSPCELELAESLEQLRFLFHSMKIKVHETQEEAIGIDLPEHLARAEQFLSSRMKSS